MASTLLPYPISKNVAFLQQIEKQFQDDCSGETPAFNGGFLRLGSRRPLAQQLDKITKLPVAGKT
jgi:hypothetical protein